MVSILDPEEWIGSQWHRLVGGTTSLQRYPDAAVDFETVRGRLGVMFRALGGSGGVRIAKAASSVSVHRTSLRVQFGRGGDEKIDLPSFDGATVLLPALIDLLPERRLNEALYEWLAAWFAQPASPQAKLEDPLQIDVARLRTASDQTRRLLHTLPGLAPTHAQLVAAHCNARPARRLPPVEADVERAVLMLLRGDRNTLPALLDPAIPVTAFKAPSGYRRFLPVLIWGDFIASPPASPARTEDDPDPAGATATTDSSQRKARRRENDQTRRRDPLLLNRFETIMGIAEMVNLNRAIEDDDEDGARKAADDLDEITISQHSRQASTRLKLELDLAPAAIDTGGLDVAEAQLFYPEWDHKRGCYHPAYCRVSAGPAADGYSNAWAPDADTRNRIRRVRRQFEALRPKRQVQNAQPDGEDLDLAALVRSLVDRRAGVSGSDRVYSSARTTRRDLAVAVLADVSLSTDSWIGDRPVLDVEKEALLALAGGLDACGDDYSILTFTSRRRENVLVRTAIDFGERLNERAVGRILALRPGHYTRMGAAIRHTASVLAKRPHGHRLLLLLTDGKPNDADHYEGRYAVEDTRMAIRDARRLGIKVFGITVDTQARDYFPYIFGHGAFAIVGDITRLPTALPAIYRQVTA